MGEPPEERARIRAAYDAYAADTTSRWSPDRPGNRAIHAERDRLVARMLADGPEPDRVLEVGCGGGSVLAGLPAGRVSRVGLDLQHRRLEAARDRLGPVVVEGDGAALPWPAASFDLVAGFTLLSSVLDEGHRRQIAGEITRVLRPGGRLLIYDLRWPNPRNPHVRPVRGSDLARLFPGWEQVIRTTTLAPPLARRLGPLTTPLYAALATIPLLRSHLLARLTRPG